MTTTPTCPATCGCCEGVQRLTPRSVANRPGLSALVYRVGTHASFLQTMLADLTGFGLEVPTQEVDANGRLVTATLYPLDRLTTRAPDDFSIALLDGWATVADVLTFYQERIANEGYLRTATERRSVAELARLVGYVPRPGVSASVHLAYTLDPDVVVTIPAGSRAQSIPAPTELPQTFETSDAIEAQTAWNALRPRRRRPPVITLDALGDGPFDLYLRGTLTGLRPGDGLLFVFGTDFGEQVFRRVAEVEPEPDEDRTYVRLQDTEVPVVRQAIMLAAADRIAAAIERHRQLDAFRVSPGTVSGRVLDILDRLETRMAADPPASLAMLRDEILPRLRVEEARARDQGWRRLAPWIGGLVVALHEAVEAAGGPVAPPAGQVATTLGDLVKPLVKPPAPTPANATRLRQDVATAFGAHSDVAARMLVTTNPSLATTLYTALAHADVAPPAPIRTAHAPRVKAAPFGHNAPLRPVYDSRGAVERYEEWPLATATIVSRLAATQSDQSVHAAFEPATLVAEVSVRAGGRSGSVTIPLDQDEQRVEGDGFSVLAIVERQNQGGPIRAVELTVDGESFPRRRVRMARGQGNDELNVSLVTLPPEGDPQPDTVSPVGIRRDSVYRYARGERRVKIEWSTAGGDALEVTDELAVAPGQLDILTLDARYDQIVPESWLIVQRGTRDPLIVQVQAARTVSVTEYGLTASVTQVRISAPWLDRDDRSLAALRETTVWAQTEPLDIAEEPVEDDVRGETVELDGVYRGLTPGRWAIVTGERTDIPGTSGVPGTELVMLAGVTHDVQQIADGEDTVSRPGDKIHTTIRLAAPLAYTYRRDTVSIYGNVVRATHGETHQDVLGSGDGSTTFQTFALRQQPLTYVAAVSPSGVESTLHVRVDGVLWHEAESLAFLGPRDRRYVTRVAEDGTTSVTFGNGWRGARLPTGRENVTVTFRAGLGKPGNVAAGQISLPVSRPPGVFGVVNPLPATGGADPESRDDVRRRAPLALLALDRLVSVRDFEDFALTFAGVGKASAVRLTDGRRQLTHLTIAGADDIPIARDSDLYRSLVAALRRFGDPAYPFLVATRRLRLLVIEAEVRLRPDYLWEHVERRLRAALLDRFGFARRELGQDVLRGEVTTTIQQVEGVLAADLNVLDALDEDAIAALVDDPGGLAAGLGLEGRIEVHLARPDPAAATLADRIRPAELAVLSPAVPQTLILREAPA